MKFLRTALIAAAALWALSAHAQWQVPNNSIPVGKGTGVVGFGSVANTGMGNLCLINTAPPVFASCLAGLPVIVASNYITCDGVTDNTTGFANLATAVGTGGKRIVMPQGECRTASWDMSSKQNFIVEGASGSDVTETVTGTMVTCTQTGATTCFNWANARGVQVRDLTFAYNSATYTGTILSIAQTTSVWAGCSFDGVQFKQSVTTSHTATAALYVKNASGCVIRNTKFEHTLNGIVGDFNGGSAANTTNLACMGCTFIGLEQAAVRNPGPEWSFHGSWFFASLNGLPVGIISEAANVIESLTISGSSFTDATIAGTWIDLGTVHGYTHSGGVIGGNGGVAVVGIKLGVVRGAQIQGIHGTSLGTGIQVTGACDGLTVSGVDFFSVTTPKTGTTACTNSLFTGNSPTSLNTLGVAAGKTLIASNTMTFAAGADGNTYTFSSISGTIASLNTSQVWSNTQFFADGNLNLNGATSGVTVVKAPAIGGGTATFFQGTDTIAGLAANQALTNKTYNGNTWTAGTGTLTIAAGKTLTANNSITLAGTDATTMTFPSTSTTVAGLSIANVFTANQAISLSQAAATSYAVANTNTSTSASAAFTAQSNSGTFSASAANNPNGGGQAGFTWTGSGGMLFASTHASGAIVFDSGGFNERIRVLASGAVNFGASATDLGAVGRVNVEDYIVTKPVAVASLPTCNAAAKGARSFVNNATSTTFASTVAGGGANNVPVVCDGTNWIIG